MPIKLFVNSLILIVFSIPIQADNVLSYDELEHCASWGESIDRNLARLNGRQSRLESDANELSRIQSNMANLESQYRNYQARLNQCQRFNSQSPWMCQNYQSQMQNLANRHESLRLRGIRLERNLQSNSESIRNDGRRHNNDFENFSRQCYQREHYIDDAIDACMNRTGAFCDAIRQEHQ